MESTSTKGNIRHGKLKTKKELKKALNSKESTRTEKKPIDAKLHAKNVHNKFKEICSDRGEMPL